MTSATAKKTIAKLTGEFTGEQRISKYETLVSDAVVGGVRYRVVREGRPEQIARLPGARTYCGRSQVRSNFAEAAADAVEGRTLQVLEMIPDVMASEKLCVETVARHHLIRI